MSPTSIHGFAFPTSIRFGPGARKEVAQHLIANGRTRPLVVTDRGLAALPVFERFLGDLAKLATATDSAPEPAEEEHDHDAEPVPAT